MKKAVNSSKKTATFQLDSLVLQNNILQMLKLVKMISGL